MVSISQSGVVISEMQPNKLKVVKSGITFVEV